VIGHLPIRMRLTLWYFAMFASAATLLCGVSLWMLQRSVDVTEYHDLQERAQDVRAVLGHLGPDLTLDQINKEFSLVYEWKDDGKFLQVQEENGDWLYRSKRMIAQKLETQVISDLPKEGRTSDLNTGSHRIRILSYPIEVRGKRYLVQTGISLQKSAALLTNFRVRLLLLMPMVIVLAGIGGHLMSRKALRPIAILATETRRINERNLDIRLPVSPVKDEISDLSQTLNEMLERIDKAFVSVRTFTGNASHELRTPVSLLRTEIEVALYRPRDPDEYRAILRRLHEETVHMTCLVENLLSLARAEAGAEMVALAPIRLGALFRETTGAWKTAMALAKLTFSIEVQESDLIVMGDFQGIKRLLSILLENACKYTPPGKWVILRATAANGHVDISVHDSGIGIDPAFHDKVFERFFRVENGGSTSGAGLGLALAKWIAQRHGSQLLIESFPGQGSCFSFRLTRADSALVANPDMSVLNDSEIQLSVMEGIRGLD